MTVDALRLLLCRRSDPTCPMGALFSSTHGASGRNGGF